MAYAAGGAGGGAAAAAAIAQAIKASGAIVSMEPRDFMAILAKSDKPLLIHAQSTFFKTTHHYLTGYRGLTFYTKSPSPLPLTFEVELISAKKIWIPG